MGPAGYHDQPPRQPPAITKSYRPPAKRHSKSDRQNRPPSTKNQTANPRQTSDPVRGGLTTVQRVALRVRARAGAVHLEPRPSGPLPIFDSPRVRRCRPLSAPRTARAWSARAPPRAAVLARMASAETMPIGGGGAGDASDGGRRETGAVGGAPLRPHPLPPDRPPNRSTVDGRAAAPNVRPHRIASDRNAREPDAARSDGHWRRIPKDFVDSWRLASR